MISTFYAFIDTDGNSTVSMFEFTKLMTMVGDLTGLNFDITDCEKMFYALGGSFGSTNVELSIGDLLAFFKTIFVQGLG
jgi:hypothetical protein